MKYGIASYKRPECRTIRTLMECGVNNTDIIVSTQTAEDYEQYKRNHPEVDVIFKEKDCAAGNRNTILEYIAEDVLLLDDDIVSFKLYDPVEGRWVVKTKEAFNAIVKMFDISKENHCELFGISASSNSIVTRNRGEYDTDCLLQGTVIGIVNSGMRFNEQWKMVEDYEFSLRAMKKGIHILRNNWLNAGKPQNGTNEGGLHERYQNGELKYWIYRLGKKYPEFKPNKKMDGGMIKHGK